MKILASASGFGVLVLCFACEPGAQGPSSPAPPGSPDSPQFTDVTERSGVDFVTVCGDRDKDYVISVNGAGVALLDYDNDGDLDIYLVNGSRLPPPYGKGPGSPPPSDALFRNLGDFRFENVTAAAGLTESDWGCGVAVGDYDNDGDPDIFVANYGRDRLWRNEGDGTFSDVSTAAGTVDSHWGSSCAFLDYDGDGLLDLFVVNYLDFDPAAVKRRGSDPGCQYKGQPILCGPIGLPPAPCTLYHNRGDGSFEDVSESSGIRAVDLAEATYGLGVAVLDFDLDDRPDIYVANDTKPNLLFHNRGDGSFEEIGMRSGVALNDEAIAQAGMGVDAVFLGDHEREDLFVANYEDDNNTYYRNDGDRLFTENTTPMGLASPCFKNLGWACFFFDADLDGDLDLYIAQGHVVPQSNQIPSSPGYAQRNKLFLNDGGGAFEDASERSGPGLLVKKSSRGAAFGDLDGDGDPDIVVNEIDAAATVLENLGKPRNHWLAVMPVGTRSNRSGIGAIVTLRSAARTQRRRIRSGHSYASQSELLARFGLGSSDRVEGLTVRWPTGEEEAYEVGAADRLMKVVEGEGKTVE